MTAFYEDENERALRHRMEVAALNEEIDRLLAALKQQREKAERVDALEEKIRSLTIALDEALAIIRARNAIRAQEEACEL